MKKMKKKHAILLIILILLFTYLLTYSFLSYKGSYIWLGTDVKVAEWQPKYTTLILQIEVHSIQGFQGFPIEDTDYIVSANIFGYIYFPLIVLDQKYFHKTMISM